MSAHLLAVDAGTTGVTSIVFDADLRPVRKAYREFAQHFPRPGWVEHEASDILDAVDATMREVLRAGEELSAIGITNQRETVFALDIERGQTLGRGIVWQDRRTAEACAQLREQGREELVKQRTGLLLDPYFSATKIAWKLEQEPEVRARARAGHVRFVTVDALIVFHLTGECATDVTNAARTLLFDIDERTWSDELCELFGVERDWLPTVKPSNAHFGDMTLPDGTRVPVHGIAGDQQAALFGQGCFERGSLKNTYGTGCFLMLNTGAQRVDSQRGLLTTLAVDRSGAACYALEGSVFAAGLVLQWLRDQLGIIATAPESEALARTVESTDGVYLVPAFTGLGAPYWDADARAALIGLTRGSGRGHIARAALEGIAFQCAEIVQCLRADTGMAVGELLVDGGASANDLLMQLQADFAGVDILRPANVETTARGAAALAGLGAGVWSDPGQAAALGEEHRRFEARLSVSERDARLVEWRTAVGRVRTR